MNVVITGSTAGLGLALAKKFLEAGDRVVISSRFQDHVSQTIQKFLDIYPSEQVFGFACDVSNPAQVQSLVQEAEHKMGGIDIWINNAGTSYFKNLPLVENTDEMILAIVNTNLLGILFGCREALRSMRKKNKGMIINIAGRGTEGETAPNQLVYGSTKRSLDVIHKTLVKETKNIGIGIHLVSPGMIITRLLVKEDTSLRTKKIFNILAEQPDTVASVLVPKIRSLQGTGKKIFFLTRKGALIRFLTAFRYKNKFFDEKGELKIKIDPFN